MKKTVLIILLVVLISLAVATPVLAGGGDNPSKACVNIWGSGRFLMWGFYIRNQHAAGNGNPYGPGWGYHQACYETPPKAWWK